MSTVAAISERVIICLYFLDGERAEVTGMGLSEFVCLRVCPQHTWISTLLVQSSSLVVFW